MMEDGREKVELFTLQGQKQERISERKTKLLHDCMDALMHDCMKEKI